MNFTGNYTFLDANHNGISDAWEMDYFGSVATNRTQLTDTDHDGMSDYAKFIAGTDPTNPASRFYFTGEPARATASSRCNGPWSPTGCIRSVPPPIFEAGSRSPTGCRHPTIRP